MKVNFTKQLKDLSGNTITENHGEGKEVNVTLAFVCSAAVLTGDPKKEEGWEKKLRRYELASKIRNSKGAIDIPSEDITLIKESLGIAMPPMYCGQAVKMIEGNG